MSSGVLVFDDAPSLVAVLDGPQIEEMLVVTPDGQEVLVVSPGGPPGPQGPPGPAGQAGPAGSDYYQEFGFATPATTWTVVHNQNTFGLGVETVDTNGESIEGSVRYVTPNTIEIDWYYPTAGTARLFS